MPAIALVVSDFNWEITSMMEKEAMKEASDAGAMVVATVHVNGVFDSPLAVQRMLERKDVTGVAVLGAVIKGKTKHDEVIVDAAAQAITRLSLEFRKPVGFGMIGPGATETQAMERAVEYAKRAVRSALNAQADG